VVGTAEGRGAAVAEGVAVGVTTVGDGDELGLGEGVSTTVDGVRLGANVVVAMTGGVAPDWR